MPSKAKFSREEVIAAAVDLVREKGIEALTARGLGERLGSSARPIFTVFDSMEQVKSEVIQAAGMRYQQMVYEEMESQKYPPYKASGMAYIRFAREEKLLFQLLFMRDRTGEEENPNEIDPIVRLIRQNTGLDEETARLFHLETWAYVHGIAAMMATNYLELDEELISRMLTDHYQGLKYRHKGKENG
ncbi:MAG: TetR/AcrR family transcriptional regulator [Clostridiales bacterium]|nr:TetR/AcrR family transcriptional regulator [Clostridiales bacterium]